MTLFCLPHHHRISTASSQHLRLCLCLWIVIGKRNTHAAARANVSGNVRPGKTESADYGWNKTTNRPQLCLLTTGLGPDWLAAARRKKDAHLLFVFDGAYEAVGTAIIGLDALPSPEHAFSWGCSPGRIRGRETRMLSSSASRPRSHRRRWTVVIDRPKMQLQTTSHFRVPCRRR